MQKADGTFTRCQVLGTAVLCPYGCDEDSWQEEVICATTAAEEYRGRRGSHIIIGLPDNEGRRSAGVRGAMGERR